MQWTGLNELREKYLSFFLLDRLGPAAKVSRPALRMCEMTLFYLK